MKTPIALDALKEANSALTPLLPRVKLLFGRSTVQPAERAVRNVTNAASLFAGTNQWIIEEIEKHGDANLEIHALDKDHGLQASGFDASDETSISDWTRLLLESAADHREDFIRACVERISDRHPSDFDLAELRAPDPARLQTLQ